MDKNIGLIIIMIFIFVSISSVAATEINNQTENDSNSFDSIDINTSDNINQSNINIKHENTLLNDDSQNNKYLNKQNLHFSVKSTHISTSLIGEDMKSYYKNGTYTVTLKDSSNKLLSGKTVGMQIIGKTYYLTTDSEGKARLPINLNPGVYQINVIFKGDGVYSPSSVSNNFTVVSTLEGKDLVKAYKNASQFYIRAYNNHGGFLSNQYLDMNIIGKIYKIKTDNEGLAKLDINLIPGKYILTVTNPNDGLMQSYSIEVIKENVLLTCDNFVINRAGEDYQVKLTDIHNHPLADQAVKIIANGVQYQKVTDDNGIAKLKINYNEGTYKVYAIFDGNIVYNKASSSTKLITRVPSSQKLNPTLEVNDTLFKENGDYFYVKLKDNNGFPLVNQKILFTFNKFSSLQTTDANGIAKLEINLNSGNYSVISKFMGSTYYNSIQKTSLITMDFTPNVSYSLKVPMYVNVTGLTVSKSYSPSKYIIKEGENGIVKVPTTRTFLIKLNNTIYNFVSGVGKSSYDSGLYTYLNKNSYFINSNGIKTQVNNNFSPTIEGVLIKDLTDYVELTYYGIVKPKNINQFSVASTPTVRGAYFAQENMRIIVNNKEKANIVFSEPLPYYEDYGLKLQLNKGKYILNNTFISQVSYNKFNTSNLKYYNTSIPLEYSLSGASIFNNPQKDLITTTLNVSGSGFERNEIFSYGYTNYIKNKKYEIVQSYAIADKIVKDADLQYWLNQKSNFNVAYMNVTQVTFLNALSVLWLSDKYANTLSKPYNVTWSRNNFFTVLSGVESNYKIYISSLNPTMGRTILGLEENVNGFSLFNSLILSEIENVILRNNGYNVTSPVSFIVYGFLEGQSIDLIPDNESNSIILKLTNNNEYYIIFDLNNYIIHGIYANGEQIYKGAYSYDTFGGCCGYLYANQFNNLLTNFMKNFLDAFFDLYKLLGTAGGLAITMGLVASGPLGWGVAFGIIAGGVVLNAAGSHLLDNIGKPNAGYYNLKNVADFTAGIALSFIGGRGALTADKVLYQTEKVAISSYIKDYSYKTSIKTKTVDYSSKSISNNLKHYSFKTKMRDVYHCSLGKTHREKVYTIIKEHTQNSFVSAVISYI